ncbi:hypothetical protein B0H21DRAFT_303621 [Amylocystis lapponica]|nr:hypothetical protein B0H21DRAFT_303621 [Amylocystis lapponica]
MGRILRPADPVPKRPSKPRPFQNSTAASSSDRSGNTALQPGNVPSELFKYIHNNLPINLVHAGSKRLYGRSAIWKKTSDELYKKGGKRGKLQWRDVEDKIKEKLQYAILSHRWLQEGEPTYEEMLLYPQLGRRRTNGLGFRKLREVCKKARTYGCEWVWVDTCCIDKRSSAELDESIRSMYRWYRDAKDQWFSRGWTLQELLAPSQIKFFTKNWRPLTADTNDKVNDSLSEIISERSGIPISQLRAFSPGVAMIREKMRWASGRNTTRIEDVGYSLICLFDVTMPIAYGEGPAPSTGYRPHWRRRPIAWTCSNGAANRHRIIPCSPAVHTAFIPPPATISTDSKTTF